jgi:hypothetical protein
LHFNLSANPHLHVVFSIFPSTEAEKSHRCAAGDWGDNRPKATSSAQLFARRRETFFRSAPFSPPSAAFWSLLCKHNIFIVIFMARLARSSPFQLFVSLLHPFIHLHTQFGFMRFPFRGWSGSKEQALVEGVRSSLHGIYAGLFLPFGAKQPTRKGSFAYIMVI